MWSRSELKESAKEVLKRTYWVSVLAAFILGIVRGSSGGVNFNFNIPVSSSDSYQSYSATQEDFFNALEQAQAFDEIQFDEDEYEPLSGAEILQRAKEEFAEAFADIDLADAMPFFMIFSIFAITAAIVGTVVYVLAFCPMQVGCRRYFIRARSGEGKIDDVVFAFKDNYKNVTWIMLVRLTKLCLWYMLLIIPGIVKSYEYMMVPYILADNPATDKDTAFEMSRNMMDGNKMAAFMLHLSFLGWYILAIFTLGLLCIFYVNPYRELAAAELYHTLKAENEPYGYSDNR